MIARIARSNQNGSIATPEQAARLEQKVAEGLHSLAHVALDAAVELPDEYDCKLAALRRDIQRFLEPES